MGMLTGFRKATGKCLGHVTCRLLQCSRSALFLCCAHSGFRLRVGEFPDHKWSRHSSAGQPQPCSREWGSCLHSHTVCVFPCSQDWEECCNCLYSLASASVWLLAPAPSQQHGGRVVHLSSAACASRICGECDSDIHLLLCLWGSISTVPPLQLMSSDQKMNLPHIYSRCFSNCSFFIGSLGK